MNDSIVYCFLIIFVIKNISKSSPKVLSKRFIKNQVSLFIKKSIFEILNSFSEYMKKLSKNCAQALKSAQKLYFNEIDFCYFSSKSNTNIINILTKL